MRELEGQPQPSGDSRPRLSGGPEASGRSAFTRVDHIASTLKQIAETYADQIRQKFPNIPRRVSGYNLNYLLPENGFHVARALVGSEGTCATILEATCRLIESPPSRVLVVLAYPDIYQCADHIPEILEHKPIGLEGFDDLLVYYERTKGINTEGLALLPEGGGWLMVEFGAESIPGAEMQAQRLIDALRRGPNPPNVKLYSGANAKRVWEVRESSLGATSHVPGEPLNWEGWEDAAVAPEKLGGYLRDLRKMMADFRLQRLALRTLRPCLRPHAPQLRPAIERGNRQVPQVRRRSRRPRSQLRRIPLRRTRRRTSPRRTPSENVRPRIDGGLPQIQNRLGSRLEDEPRQADPIPTSSTRTSASARTTLRGNRRRISSFRSRSRQPLARRSALCRRRQVPPRRRRRDVSQLARHARRRTLHPRPRPPSLGDDARPAREDAIIRDQWRSEEVKHSLDLCLACKGCKSDCPVSVDVATYKAEFLSHYYEGRLRPLNAYAFGNIDFWASLASKAPGLVNLTTQLPFLSDLAKKIGGIPSKRRIPPFAPQTFKQWFSLCRGGRLRPPRERQRAWSTASREPDSPNPWQDSPEGAECESPAANRGRAALQRRRRPPRKKGFSPRSPPLGRHLQQLLPPPNRPRRRRGPGNRRIPRPRPPSQPLLRTPPLRLRHARPRRTPAARNPRPTRTRNRSRHPRRRTGTLLRSGLPRRTHQPLPPRRPRPSVKQTNVPAKRIPRTKTNSRRDAASTKRAKPYSTATATTNP